jgi:hypothetical protein
MRTIKDFNDSALYDAIDIITIVDATELTGNVCKKIRAELDAREASETIERDCMQCENTFEDDGTHDYCERCRKFIEDSMNDEWNTMEYEKQQDMPVSGY